MPIFQIINRFSLLLLPLLVFLVLAVVLWRRRAKWPLWAAWGGLLAVCLAFVLMTGQTTTARS